MATLRLDYTVTVPHGYTAELRLGYTDADIARAIEECTVRSGLFHGRQHINLETIRFTIEGDANAHG
jgi:hypothetical protein